MKIESVNNANQLYSSGQSGRKETAKTEENKNTNRKSDTLVLSSQAMNLKPLEAKIKSNEYDKPEVLNAVAKKLNQLYPPSSPKA